MEILIYLKYVEIHLSEKIVYTMPWDSLNKVEKAIEIIRNIQNTAPIETARIKIA